MENNTPKMIKKWISLIPGGRQSMMGQVSDLGDSFFWMEAGQELHVIKSAEEKDL